MANKLLIKRSSELNKIPQPDLLEYGEIALNNAEGSETIFFKNSNNKVVEVKTKEYYEKIISDNELNTSEELDEIKKKVQNNTNEIAENALVTAEALVDLDNRLLNIENIDTSILCTKEELTNALSPIDTRVSELENIDNSVFCTKEELTNSLSPIDERVSELENIDTSVFCTKEELTNSLLPIDERVSELENVDTSVFCTKEELTNSLSPIDTRVSELENIDFESYAIKNDVTNQINDVVTDINETTNELQNEINLIEEEIKKLGVTPIVEVTDSVVNINSNIYYRFVNPMESIEINFNTPDNENIINHYMFEFSTSDNNCSLILPDTILWYNNIIPYIESNKTYQFSIINNLGIVVQANNQ